MAAGSWLSVSPSWLTRGRPGEAPSAGSAVQRRGGQTRCLRGALVAERIVSPLAGSRLVDRLHFSSQHRECQGPWWGVGDQPRPPAGPRAPPPERRLVLALHTPPSEDAHLPPGLAHCSLWVLAAALRPAVCI